MSMRKECRYIDDIVHIWTGASCCVTISQRGNWGRGGEVERRREQYHSPTPSRVTRSSIPILLALLHCLSCHGLTVALIAFAHLTPGTIITLRERESKEGTTRHRPPNSLVHTLTARLVCWNSAVVVTVC